MTRILQGLAIGILLLGCNGSDGATGATGAAGPSGIQGAVGAAGQTGATGASGAGGTGIGTGDAGAALPTGCLSPCHGFNGVVAQYKTSVHYATYIANIGGTEADSWTADNNACGNCHAIDGIEQRLAGNVGAPDGGVVNMKSGQVEYRKGSGAVADSLYLGGATVAQVDCTTCHAVTDANDPHRTGVAWTDGSFPLRVATGKNDVAYIEKSPEAGAVVGTPLTLGTANACVFCHKSRKDITNYILPGSSNNISTYWGPHEGPQTDVYSGQGGYHFAGRSYASSTHQAKLTCVDCHMPNVATNSNVPDHSFNPQLSACVGCHTGATTFDVNGGESLVTAAMKELQGAFNTFNTTGYLTRSAAAPYAQLQPSELADGHFELDTGKSGSPPLTADQAGALYNYFLIARGGARGVHNPKYTQQLIFDSYFALTGNPPVSIPRPN